jgi:hypothetical protein
MHRAKLSPKTAKKGSEYEKIVEVDGFNDTCRQLIGFGIPYNHSSWSRLPLYGPLAGPGTIGYEPEYRRSEGTALFED